jgi:anthranilate/para-aminobenzoate synthase component I
LQWYIEAMPISHAGRVLSAPAEARPALLEGRWLRDEGGQAIAASGPVSTLEGEAAALAELPAWLAWHAVHYPEGGAIGYLTYELARVFERVPLSPDVQLPELSFSYYPRIERVATGELPAATSLSSAVTEILRGFDKLQFVADVERIRQLIAAGDIYQANLTQQFVARLNGLAPESLYARLSCGQAPMRAFLRTPRVTIVSDSPERFFHVRGNRILTSPIKGTVPRGGNQAQDEELRRMLLASKKDRAENVMIVDLLRNDLGRICHYETIHARLWEVETLPHLFHLVSHVEGELRPESGPLEIVRALFPCGSITGAPKIRAMEILAELEKSPRGISMGAIGIIRGAPGSPQLEMDFNVAIRTITVCDSIATFSVGCGIVYDSQPDAEYEEMLLKARPLLAALALPAHGERQTAEAVTARR